MNVRLSMVLSPPKCIPFGCMISTLSHSKLRLPILGSAAEGSYFSSRGMRQDQNTWNIGGSLNYKALCNLTFSVIYDYETSRSYFDHEGMLALDYRF